MSDTTQKIEDHHEAKYPGDLPVGWICPVCGAGNSPYNNTCSCKRTWNIPIVTCNSEPDHIINTPQTPIC